MTLENVLLDNKYLVGAQIGRGGMGAVYSAQHVGTGRRVAIKVLLPDLLNSPEAAERFRREARAAGGIRHPNVVDVTDFGVCQVGDSEVAYLAMEYLEGVTLRDLLESQGSLPVRKVVAIVEQVALALEAAHRSGIVHRDLKPENIWLVPDARGGHVVRVLDFGIASLRESGASWTGGLGSPATRRAPSATIPAADSTDTLDVGGFSTSLPTISSTADHVPTGPLTEAGSTLGTPAYMSPEQCEGREIDARSDIYSLGVIAYEALSGRRPFTGTIAELVWKHVNEVPEPLARAAKLPVAISDAVARALAKSPEERFGSAIALAGSLYAAAEAPGVIIRRAIALYADEFPIFWRLALRAAVPGVALGVPVFLLAWFLPRLPAILFLDTGITMAGVIVFMRCDAFFASLIAAMRDPSVGSLTVTEVIDDVKRRLGISKPIGAVGFAIALWRFYFREHNFRSASSTLAFHIRLLEGRTSAEIPERVRLLAGGARQRLRRIEALLAVFLATLMAVQGFAAICLCLLLKLDRPLLAAGKITAAMLPLDTAIIAPVYSTAVALLYFRARQAIGENVPLTSLVPAKL